MKTLRVAADRVLGRLLPGVEAGACPNPRAGDCCKSWGVWTCDWRCIRTTLC